MAFDPQEVSAPGAKIKVIGVGGGGTNAVSTMIRSNIEGVEFVSANTDVQSLRFALAPSKIQIGKELTKGLGAGADPDIGRDAALEDRHELQETIADSDMVFVTAGMGGGTGTGGAAIVSQIARESGALTVGVVTKPFSFEGKRRRKHAELGIARLKEHVDTLVVIPNDRLLKIATPDLSMLEAFKMADTVLVNAVRGISDIINVPGTINVDFADVKTIMSSMGQALMGIGSGTGENRAQEAARQAISSPLLEDVDIEGATGILINITAGEKISLVEINDACSIIEEAAHEDANIIFGAVIDESMKDSIRITVIATGFPTSEDDDFLISARQDNRSSYSRFKPGASARTAVSKQPANLVRSTIGTSNSSKNSFDQNETRSKEESSKSNVKEHRPDSFFVEEPRENRTILNEIEDTDLAQWTMDQIEQNGPPQVEDSIAQEIHHEDPDIGLIPDQRASNGIDGRCEKNIMTSPNDDSDHNAIEFQQIGSDLLENKKKRSGSPKVDDTFQSFEENDHNFLHDTNSTLSDDIDKRIDEALELAEKVHSLDSKDDNLDVPAFLRNNTKDLNL